MSDEPSRGALAASTSRLEAFSDGVFAIAITLLVLEIGVPEHSGDRLLEAIGDQWPSYLAYLISFGTIGAIWLAHQAITEYIERVDTIFLRLNLLLLLAVSFLPFPTRVVAEYLGEDAERAAVTFYGVTLLVASLVLSGLWHYALRGSLVRPDARDEDVQILTERLTPGLGGYAILIVVGLFLPSVAVVGYLALAVFLLVPARLLRRRSR